MSALESFYTSSFNQRSTDFPAWFANVQQQAFERYQQQGLPTRKTEQWKYTSVENLKQLVPQIATVSIEEKAQNFVVRVEDGFITIPKQLPAGVSIMKLSEALENFKDDLAPLFDSNNKHAQCFEHINMALMSEGLFIHIDKNIQVNTPLTVEINTSTLQQSQHLQHVVYVEEGARFKLVEQFSAGAEAVYFNNHVLQSIVKDNAHLEYVKVIDEAPSAFHIGKTNLFLHQNAQAICHSFALNGQMLRSDINADLLEQGAHVSMNGLYLTSNTQNVAHYTRANHLKPHATSDEVYKGILGGKSKGTFNGTVYVAKDAQKTDASQQNKNLLLSDKAEINTKPQLEIFADDVKCAHGATIGQLDETAMFYLQSRGIAKKEAASLLVNAFAGDLIEKLSTENFSDLKQHLHTHLEKHLRQSDDV